MPNGALALVLFRTGSAFQSMSLKKPRRAITAGAAAAYS
jgi:hypothetical protein